MSFWQQISSRNVLFISHVLSCFCQINTKEVFHKSCCKMLYATKAATRISFNKKPVKGHSTERFLILL